MIEAYNGYKNGLFPFPKHDIDPKLKLKKEWHLQYSKAIIASWLQGKTGIAYNSTLQFKGLRQFADGEQPPEKYMEILLDEEESDAGERKGWMNVNWEIFSVAPKFMNVVIGMFEEQEFDVSASAVDPISSMEREEKKWSTWFNSVHRGKLKDIRKKMGVPPPDDGYLPESIQELNLFEELGGFKLGKEISMENGIDYTLYISDWKEIKRKMIRDLLACGATAVRDYVDKTTQKVRVKYSDPERTIIQQSEVNNHKDASWGGYIEKVPIHVLRMETDLDEDQLYEIAMLYSGSNNNIDISEMPSDDMKLSDGSYKYDYMTVDVLEAEFVSVNSEYKTKRKNNRGEEYYFDETFGKFHNSEKKKTEVQKKHQVYASKLILGTDYIYDYGYQYDVPRPGKKEVRLSFHVYKVPGRSLISNIIPNLDNLQIAWLKFQNNLAQASAPGLAVEYSSLQNMLLGGHKAAPMEILSVRRDTGDLIYRATTHRGLVNSPHAGKPVVELEGGMGRSLDEFVRIFEMNLAFIREFTGINKIADASDPNPQQSVGGSQLAVAATANALKPVYSGYISIKERTALNVALRMQIVIKYNKQAYKGYYPVLGQSGVKLLSIGAEVVDVDFAFKLEARPDDEMKQTIRNAAIQAMQPDRDGHAGIEMPDYLMVERLMDLGNLKLAQALLSERIRKNKQLTMERQRENMELDAKREQEAIQLKEQMEEKKDVRENELNKDFETHKHKLKMQELEKEGEIEANKMQVEKTIDAVVAEQENKQETNSNKQEGKPNN